MKRVEALLSVKMVDLVEELWIVSCRIAPTLLPKTRITPRSTKNRSRLPSLLHDAQTTLNIFSPLPYLRNLARASSSLPTSQSSSGASSISSKRTKSLLEEETRGGLEVH